MTMGFTGSLRFPVETMKSRCMNKCNTIFTGYLCFLGGTPQKYKNQISKLSAALQWIKQVALQCKVWLTNIFREPKSLIHSCNKNVFTPTMCQTLGYNNKTATSHGSQDAHNWMTEIRYFEIMIPTNEKPQFCQFIPWVVLREPWRGELYLVSTSGRCPQGSDLSAEN